MMVMLPEPDYYTLAEVAKRWDVTEDYLLRVGNEGKIKLAYKLPLLTTVSLYDPGRPSPVTRKEFERLFPNSVDLFDCVVVPGKKFMLDILNNRWEERFKRKISPMRCFDRTKNGLVEYLQELEWPPDVSIKVFGYGVLASQFLESPNKQSNAIDQPLFDSVTHFMSNSLRGCGPLPFPPIPDGWILVSDIKKIPFSELLISSEEVHRFEHQREAAADDALGTKERETMQAVIAALAQLVARSAPHFKHGDKPNASQIAEQIAPLIPNREARTIRKCISDALKAGLI
jgi:hypothetical protein